MCSMQISRTVQNVFQYGVKQRKAVYESLGCLNAVVTKKAQVSCGQASSNIVWSWKISLKLALIACRTEVTKGKLLCTRVATNYA